MICHLCHRRVYDHYPYRLKWWICGECWDMEGGEKIMDLEKMSDEELQELEDKINEEQSLRFAERAKTMYEAARDSKTVAEMLRKWWRK